MIEYLWKQVAQRLVSVNRMADLLIGNNVLAHVPDINEFVDALKISLKPTGTVTMEFPHLLQLIENSQFDTIYHEHFSFFSLHTVRQIFAAHRLNIIDVEELSTHGGSLRIFAQHFQDSYLTESEHVASLLEDERRAGLLSLEYYLDFQPKADRIKYDLLGFLINQKEIGKKIAAYGAAAKGNTLLNYCGVKKDLIQFVVDASSYKQGKFLPGSHIPIGDEGLIKKEKP